MKRFFKCVGDILTTSNPTLADWKASLAPDNTVAVMINQLEQTNEIINDMTFIEANEPTGHLMVVATGLPRTVWSRLYQGVKPGKGQRKQVRETVGFQEAYNQIDAKLVQLNGNGAAFRLQEARMQMEAMTQSLATKLFYGNPDVDDRDIMGLSPRYSSMSDKVGENILDGGGTGGDNRSIWLVNWGPEATFNIFPKGSEAGLVMKDLGEHTADNFGGVTGALKQVYRTYFSWDAGLGVGDWRFNARVCNIDISNLSDDATDANSANLPALMSKALRRVPRNKLMRPAWYMAGDVLEALEAQLSNAIKNSMLTIDQVGGVETTMFRKIPVRQVDALKTNEARVV